MKRESFSENCMICNKETISFKITEDDGLEYFEAGVCSIKCLRELERRADEYLS